MMNRYDLGVIYIPRFVYKYRRTAIKSVLIAIIVLLVCWSRAGVAADLQGARIEGGLVVVIGGFGRAPLPEFQTGHVIQYLDTDSGKVERLRADIMKKGQYGRISANVFDGKHLPYVDNSVNQIILDQRQSAIDSKEIVRVLAPRGLLLCQDKKHVTPHAFHFTESPAQDCWFAYTKSVPPEIDDWTHQLYDASNIGISKDKAVAPPERMQWLAGPPFTRHHDYDKGTDPAIRLVLAGNGRLYYIIDETNSSNMKVSGQWYLLARDAFSGVQLWKIPIKPYYDRKLEQVWRMMVADTKNGGRLYVALGKQEPLCQVDGATGKVIRNYPGSEDAIELVKDGDLIAVIKGTHRIQGYHAESGKQLWAWEPEEGDPLFPLTMAAAEGVVAVKTDLAVFCLSQQDGSVKWKKELQPAKVLKRLKYAHEKLIIHDGIVLASYAGDNAGVLYKDNTEYLGLHPRVKDYKGMMAALSIEDGSTLWTAPYLPSIDDGSPGEIYVQDGKLLLGPDFSSTRDLRTGKEIEGKHLIEGLWTTGHHYRCYPGKATGDYIITAKRGVEMIDIDGNNHSRANWVRATCRVGVTPANGLLYCPPHSCGCYMEAKLWGFWTLAGAREEASRESLLVPPGKRLTKGPRYGKPTLTGIEEASSDWSTYRGNNERGGSVTKTLSTELKEAWTTKVGSASTGLRTGKLTAVTSSRVVAFVAERDAHTLHALRCLDGRKIWSFTTGGRIDSPPTLYHNRVFFGSSDGHVYCLCLSTGELVWKFHAAPSIEKAIAYEQLESVWPVHGAVLLEKNVAYVSAGRSSYLDGGITLYGLNPVTGKVVSTRKLADEHTGYAEPPKEAKSMEQKIKQNWLDFKTTQEADKADSFAMHGALTDVMTSDGDSIFMRHMRFDQKLNPVIEKRQHLFSTSSLLDDHEFNRMYWALGTGDFKRTPVAYPWIVWKTMKVPFGLMMAFDKETVWSVRMVNPKRFQNQYQLCSEKRPDPDDAGNAGPDFAPGMSGAKKPVMNWQVKIPFRPRAIVRAGDILVLGGHPIEDQSKGLLQLFSSQTGEMLKRIPLPAPPTWDGLAVVEDQLLVPLENGSVISFK